MTLSKSKRCEVCNGPNAKIITAPEGIHESVRPIANLCEECIENFDYWSLDVQDRSENPPCYFYSCY